MMSELNFNSGQKSGEQANNMHASKSARATPQLKIDWFSGSREAGSRIEPDVYKEHLSIPSDGVAGRMK